MGALTQADVAEVKTPPSGFYILIPEIDIFTALRVIVDDWRWRLFPE